MGKTKIAIRLPDLGDVADVRIVLWLKGAGDPVEEGEDLLEVETEKTTFVVPAPGTGRLARVAVAEGETAVRGDVLGEIDPDA